MKLNILSRMIGLAAAGFFSAAVPVQAADTYPDRTIQMIVPYAPGGTTDLAGRIVAKAMGAAFGQSVVVENKPGAAGSLGVGQALRSVPDGYTMAVSGVSSTMIHDLLGRELPYDPKKDLNAVAYLGSSGMVVITGNNSGLKTLADIIERSKKEPGSISFGSAGNASPGHMATEYLASMAGIKMTHVPYTGDSALMTDLMSGRIDFATVGIASVFSHMKAGSVRPLAITSAERISTFPDVPTVAEAGDLAGYEADIWNLLVLPKGTPAAVDQKLNQTINQLMREKGVRESLLEIGFTAREMDIAEIQNFIQTEREKWGKVIRESNINVE
ncbi:tripartite-type tricarboxylate transporter receptor subunit TctC [Pseudochelatococcus lubricantis]|uniref:Tripartite-type tricarboxylate transporter receptor subunit TctC n=1 Tax=Pseudochelatococcus lubricantis TaxID=1538102 RepID=A0ABX0V457_9HYPH|nr:tripartite tricarboxylate transporter substrate binding protein [Pseudochelatococcus lubricantis]NIJ59025.1 tripartite-type tricarboxylate transporter receptor subunit TctC [Pseudochelatococcus lubricantis]